MKKDQLDEVEREEETGQKEKGKRKESRLSACQLLQYLDSSKLPIITSEFPTSRARMDPGLSPHPALASGG